jgi:hypothetical protein
VTFAAWLMKVKPGSPESCNCGNKNDKAPDTMDLHLVLIPSFPTVQCKTGAQTPLECKSVTVEISPHFRPDQWDEATICNAARLHPLRFTGQLMYDAAHRPLAILTALSASLALADDFKTTNGKEYKDVTVTHVEPDGIVLRTKLGISKLYFTDDAICRM